MKAFGFTALLLAIAACAPLPSYQAKPAAPSDLQAARDQVRGYARAALSSRTRERLAKMEPAALEAAGSCCRNLAPD
jgi:hypothetical protein